MLVEQLASSLFLSSGENASEEEDLGRSSLFGGIALHRITRQKAEHRSTRPYTSTVLSIPPFPRSIAENIFLIDGIINYAGNMNKPGLLMFIDFEKAFDSIEWAFIERALNYVNFGPSLVNWFRLFYNQVSIAFQNNGWVS